MWRETVQPKGTGQCSPGSCLNEVRQLTCLQRSPSLQPTPGALRGCAPLREAAFPQNDVGEGGRRPPPSTHHTTHECALSHLVARVAEGDGGRDLVDGGGEGAQADLG